MSFRFTGPRGAGLKNILPNNHFRVINKQNLTVCSFHDAGLHGLVARRCFPTNQRQGVPTVFQNHPRAVLMARTSVLVPCLRSSLKMPSQSGASTPVQSKMPCCSTKAAPLENPTLFVEHSSSSLHYLHQERFPSTVRFAVVLLVSNLLEMTPLSSLTACEQYIGIAVTFVYAVLLMGSVK